MRTPTVVDADVALVYDEQTMWAWQGDHLPTRHLDYERLAVRWHTALTETHGVIDVVPPGAHLGRYRLVVVPALYLMSATTHAWLRSYPGDIVLTAASGAVDEHARVTPGSLDDLIGARVTARRWLPPDESVALADGRTAGLCFETLRPTTAQVLFAMTDGSPAVIRNGRVTYVAAPDLVNISGPPAAVGV
jgi:beta-galactosidase